MARGRHAAYSGSIRASLRNHNVFLALLYRAIDASAQGVWNYASLSNYVYILCDHQNKYVGIMQGIQGTFLALVALPVGRLADRTRRDRVLAGHGVVGLVALAITVLSLLLPSTQVHVPGLGACSSSFLLLCCGMALFGCCYAGNPVLEALFADSTPTGQRSMLYAVLYSTTVLATALGPSLAAIQFALRGNVWTLQQLRPVILSGLAVSTVPICLLFFFNDAKSIPESESAPLLHRAPSRGNVAAAAAGADGSAATDGCGAAAAGEACDVGAATAQQQAGWWVLDASWVPVVMTCSDLMYGLASGMTIKFFSTWFLKEVGLEPVATNLIFAATPLLLATLSLAAQRLSRAVGRVQSCLVFRIIGVSLILYLGWRPCDWKRKGIIIPVYIVRTAAMNAAYPLQRSILMDHVAKETRAQWSSLEAIMQFGWSGSAVVGGVLIDKYGFDTTFVITGAMQALATCIFATLLPLVPRQEPVMVTEGADLEAAKPIALEAGVGRGDGDDDVACSGLREPLLSSENGVHGDVD